MTSPLAVATVPDWLVETLKKLEKLSQLPHNWDSYGAQPVRPDVLGLSVRILGSLEEEDLPVPLVTAGSSGTVQLEWEVEGRGLEMEILGEGRVGYLKVHPDGRMEEGEVSPLQEGLRDLLRWLLDAE
jgi:hypothetical protein